MFTGYVLCKAGQSATALGPQKKISVMPLPWHCEQTEVNFQVHPGAEQCDFCV